MDNDFVSKTLETLDGIAIIGMDGRFPGADSIDQFWQNIRGGIESITVFTDEELAAAGVPMATLKAPNYVKAGAVLSGVDQFDAPFFGISPREAKSMDPQHRILLECAWGALESAGYNSETYDGRIGVYTGTSLSTYLHHNLLLNSDFLNLAGDLQIELGNDKDFVPTRISYKMNLTGPSVCINTACSTSLVAVHMACQGLLDHECDMALAGGATIQVPQIQGYWYQPDGIASPDGHCCPFDAQAQGTIFGSGVGVVVLKRLDDALRDRDYIYSVIRGSAINNDGSLKVGYTAPSVDGQADAISEAQAIAGVEPDTITLIEAHGTATGMGDPIEVAALNQVFQAETDQTGFCALGSVKGNIGHLNRAAGVIGLIKTTLALKHQLLPPSLHFEKPNPQINFDRSPFYVNTCLQPWQPEGFPRRAGVSSFGIGGTNAHAVLEEAPARQPSEPSARPYQLLTLSAKTETALETATLNLAQYLRQASDLDLADVAFTLQVGRQAFNYRRILVCETLDQAIAALEDNTSQGTPLLTQVRQSSSSQSVVFMFSGQGSQYVNMARDLYQHEDIFRENVDRCIQILLPQLQLDLRQLIYPSLEPSNTAETATEKLQQTALTQPALFVIEYALAKLLMAWGIKPQAMIGHSIGEYVAACLAGVFSLEDALVLVATRGAMMQSLPKGAMLAVFLPQDELLALLPLDLALASSNSPKVSVVSGSSASIDALAETLQNQGIDYRHIHTSHAFHSPMMEPILVDFAARVSQISLKPPQIPFVSNVTGSWITIAEAVDPNYWVQHICQTVRFSEGIDLLLQDPDRILLEVGPGKSLQSLVKQHPAASERTVLSTVRHPKENMSDVAFMLQTLGQLWLSGLSLNWSKLYAPQSRQRLPLPTYPFEHQRYWVDPVPQKALQPTATALEVAEQFARFLNQSTQISNDERQLLHKLICRLEESCQPVLEAASDPDCFYQVAWQPLTRQAEVNKEAVHTSRWLILADRRGVGQALATQMAHAHQDCVLLFIGDTYQKMGSNTWELDPSIPELFAQFFQDAFGPGTAQLKGVAYLWSLEAEANAAELTTAELDAAQLLSVGSALHLVQALIRQIEKNAEETTGFQIAQNVLPKLWLITQNVMLVTDSQSNISISQSPLWGLGKVIALEHPTIWGGLIDLGDEISDQLKNLVKEFLYSDSENQLAFRGVKRYVARLVGTAQPEPEPVRLHQEGAYLITGGLGSLGLIVANWLVERGAKHLILLGRKPPSHSACLEIEQLKKSGAEIHLTQVDIAAFDDLARVFKKFDVSIPPLRGVFHVAGVPGYQAIKDMSLSTYRKVCSAKVSGTWNLHRLTQALNLDFFVNFSSISSVWGAKGQAPYTMANQFLDSFSYFRQQLGLNTLTVNWGPWVDGGMTSEAIMKQLSRLGIKSLSSEQAISSLDKLVGVTQTSLPQTVVADVDWPLLESLFKASGNLNFFNQLTDKTLDQNTSQVSPSSDVSDVSFLQMLRSQSSDECIQSLVSFLKKHTAKILNMSSQQLDPNQSLNYLGLDSLMAIELRNLIRKQFQIEISTNKFLSGVSVHRLAIQISQHLGEMTSIDMASTIDFEIETAQISSSPKLVDERSKLTELDHLSDSDVDSILQELLSE